MTTNQTRPTISIANVLGALLIGGLLVVISDNSFGTHVISTCCETFLLLPPGAPATISIALGCAIGVTVVWGIWRSEKHRQDNVKAIAAGEPPLPPLSATPFLAILMMAAIIGLAQKARVDRQTRDEEFRKTNLFRPFL